MKVAFHFDFSCPYAYLASKEIESITSSAGADFSWNPMLLGGIFKNTGLDDVPMSSYGPAKAQHNAADMHRWAQLRDVPLTMPSGHPIRTVRALRALLATDLRKWSDVIHSIYNAYWQKGLAIDTAEGLRAALADASLSDKEIDLALTANDDQTIKVELRKRTSEASSRGVFGAPTMFVSGEPFVSPIMLWGQDRLAMLQEVLGGWNPLETPLTQSPKTTHTPAEPTTVDFWFDYSSPFAYLASTQVGKLQSQFGIEVRWQPMLLGAVFNQIGTANVPLAAMVDSKRKYLGAELHMWANYWNVPFRFTSRFPMKTVTALRLALLAEDKIADLSRELFDALWVRDQDLNDAAVLTDCLQRAGLPPSLLEQTQAPQVKQRLIEQTSKAVSIGVFGAPTWRVTTPSHEYLLWGQDRLPMVEQILNGFRPSL